MNRCAHQFHAPSHPSSPIFADTRVTIFDNFCGISQQSSPTQPHTYFRRGVGLREILTHGESGGYDEQPHSQNDVWGWAILATQGLHVGCSKISKQPHTELKKSTLPAPSKFA